MLPLSSNTQRGRFLLLFVGIYLVLFIPAMMTLGSLALSEVALRWARAVVIVLCLATAYGLAQVAARKGRPRWLLKSPQHSPPA